MKRYELFGIKWDLDPGDNGAGLPGRIVVNVDPDDTFDPEYDAASYLSDNYDYCVLGCSFREI